VYDQAGFVGVEPAPEVALVWDEERIDLGKVCTVEDIGWVAEGLIVRGEMTVAVHRRPAGRAEPLGHKVDRGSV